MASCINGESPDVMDTSKDTSVYGADTDRALGKVTSETPKGNKIVPFGVLGNLAPVTAKGLVGHGSKVP